MMRLNFLKRRRVWMGLVCAVVLVGGGFGILYWYSMSVFIAGEAHYYREMSELSWDCSERLEANVGVLEGGGVTNQEETVAEVFKLLEYTPIGSSEDDVRKWRYAPASPERTASALKWGRIIARAEAFNAVMREHTAKEIERGRINEIHFSEKECEAFLREARAGRRP